MKAITICQPYAGLIAQGVKRVENRTWPTTYRGAILIHAGKSRAWLMPEDDTTGMVFGAVVAVADLVGCRKLEDLPPAWRAHVHASGPWCWMLSNVRPLEVPLPWRGAQGLFEIPDAVWFSTFGRSEARRA